MAEENVEVVRRIIAAFNSGGDARLAAEIVEPKDLGDVVLVSGKTTGRSRASDVPVEQHWFSATKFQQRKVVYVAFRRTRAEALEAAGLRE
jgi:hypothetical protein